MSERPRIKTSPAMARAALKPRGSVFNLRTVTAPIALIIMAGLLYTYSVTSIRAAKRNAALHREADGGQLDMRRESLRRHGVLDKVEGTSGMSLFRDASGQDAKESKWMGEKEANPMGSEKLQKILGEGERAPGRTQVEGKLEEYKGRGSAVRKFGQEGLPRGSAKGD